MLFCNDLNHNILAKKTFDKSVSYIIKYTHVTLVILTFISFGIRAYWMVAGSDLLQKKAVKIVPHIIDTLLLLSGLTIAIMYYGAFYQQPWLMFKLLGVVIYIVLGSIALKYGKTRKIRVAAVFGAWAVFFYIIVIVRNHAVIPF